MERVRRHRAERPGWRTLEAPLDQPLDVSASLAKLSPRPSGVIIDCLTLWAGARLADSDEAVTAALAAATRGLRGGYPWPAIVVSNELGWSLVPPKSPSPAASEISPAPLRSSRPRRPMRSGSWWPDAL